MIDQWATAYCQSLELTQGSDEWNLVKEAFIQGVLRILSETAVEIIEEE